MSSAATFQGAQTLLGQVAEARGYAGSAGPQKAEIESVAQQVIEDLTAKTSTHTITGRPGGKLGIREVALEIEERLPGVTLEQIHAALLKVANLYPCDDPRERRKPEIARQYSMAYHPSNDPSEARIWVYAKR